MNEGNVRAAVEAYSALTPESIDLFRTLTDDEVVALKVVLTITEPAKVGRPRKKKAVANG